MAEIQYTTSVNPFVVPTTVQTEIIGAYTFRYGKRERVGGWFVREVTSGEYKSLPSFAAVRWFLDQLRAKFAPTDPEPTTPAAMPLVRQQSTVYAVSDRRTDNKILTIPHGQYYSARHSSLVYIIGQFTIKYGVRPTSLRMNPIEEADWLAGDNWDGIAVEFVDGVPEDTYYLHYDPALANAA
jgi:hypothetical protein